MNIFGKEKVLVTTAIDYANDVIHIGHTYQKVLADVVARIERQRKGGDKVFFVTGTDEHGQKIFTVAQKEGITPRELVDRVSAMDQKEQDAFEISYNRFIRTTDPDHKKEAADFFEKVYKNGYIYKGTYRGLYCVGCEEYKSEKDLVDGKCPIHPQLELVVSEEDNYFFKWSAFKGFLKELFEKNPEFVLPESRYKEMFNFIDLIEDIPVTRRKEKLPWGIESSIDKDHVLWVWFDALINYITYGKQVGAWDENTFIIHFLGKDNARMHALLWPAMLKAAGYSLPSLIYVNAFLSLNGRKISKSLGNVIRPTELSEKYGVDPLRYYFLRYGPIVEDTDFSLVRFEEAYNADLANGLGNTVARLARLAERSDLDFGKYEPENVWEGDWFQPYEKLRVDLLLQNIWQELAELDKHINENEPWKISDRDRLREVLVYEVEQLRNISSKLAPFIPQTYNKIKEQFFGEKIKVSDSLFPRI